MNDTADDPKDLFPEAQRAANEADARLLEARADFTALEAQLDGSDERAALWAAGDLLVRRRMAEAKNAAARLAGVERAIADRARADALQDLEELRPVVSVPATFATIDAEAAEAVLHLLAVEIHVRRVLDLCANQRAAVAQFRGLVDRVGTIAAASEVSDDEALVVLGERLEARALALGTLLTSLCLHEPSLDDRMSLSWWRQAREHFKKTTTTDTTTESGEADDAARAE